MQKIGQSTSSANAAGEFTGGNPEAGVDATQISTPWLNTVQRELAGLVVGAGLVLDAKDDEQVLKAVRSLAGKAADFSKLTNVPTTLSGYGVTFASQPEAETGSDTSKPMSALRVFQAIAKKVFQATESALGTARIATQTLVNAGADDSTFVTPKKLRAGFAFYWSKGTFSGYIAFPTWLGGYIIQSGQISTSASDIITTLPIAFPETFMQVIVCNGYTAGSGFIGYLAASIRDQSSIVSRGSSQSLGAQYIAIGK